MFFSTIIGDLCHRSCDFLFAFFACETHLERVQLLKKKKCFKRIKLFPRILEPHNVKMTELLPLKVNTFSSMKYLINETLCL